MGTAAWARDLPGLGEELMFALETGAQLVKETVTEAGDTRHCPCTLDMVWDMSLT